jgi:predicted methyltransferase
MRYSSPVILFIGSALALSASAADKMPAVPAYISAAVADASRPDTDKERDVNRKPADVLTFAGVKPGDKVGELLPGRGYYTKIFCKIVGDKGHVYTVGITRAVVPATPPPPPPPEAANAGQACTNVTTASYKVAEFALPAALDMVWTSENYHDLNNPMFGSADMKAFNKVVYDALKPGGVFMVEDHQAVAGSGKRDTDTLHRIEGAAVIADVTAVGFKLEAQSPILANPDDPHTAGAHSLTGKTDKFLLKFRKPR